MHILLIEFKRDHQFAMLDDAIRDELSRANRGVDNLSLEQKLVISKFLIGKRELSDSADFIKEWTSEICEGVITRDAIIARLQTETTNELADKLGTTYSATYHTIMGKLKRFEKHEGLKKLFKEYYRRVDNVEDWRARRKALPKEDWDIIDEKDTILEPIKEDDLLDFPYQTNINATKYMYAQFKDRDYDAEARENPSLSDSFMRQKKIQEDQGKQIEETDRLLADFKRWLNEEGRALFE